MSLASILNSNKVVHLSNLDTENETGNRFTLENGDHQYAHYVDVNGAYHIQNSKTNAKMLSCNKFGSLLDCTVKQHVTGEVTPMNQLISRCESSLTLHAIRLDSVEALPHAQNIATLQNQVSELMNYINSLKLYIQALKETTFVSDSSGTAEYNYTGII